MSGSLFPTFPGLAWPVKRTPIFSSKVVKAVSGREIRSYFTPYPVYKIELTFEYLSIEDWKNLGGFFKLQKGKWDWFYFFDVNDNTVTAQSFGVGDGTTSTFQLVRSLGGFSEPIENLNGTPSIYKDGVLQSSGYTISSTGIVTFTPAPAAATVLTWTGNYYWRVRFDQDEAEFSENLSQFFELKKLVLWGATGNKV